MRVIFFGHCKSADVFSSAMSGVVLREGKLLLIQWRCIHTNNSPTKRKDNMFGNPIEPFGICQQICRLPNDRTWVLEQRSKLHYYTNAFKLEKVEERDKLVSNLTTAENR